MAFARMILALVLLGNWAPFNPGRLRFLPASLALLFVLVGSASAALVCRWLTRARRARRKLVDTRAAQVAGEVPDAHQAGLLTVAGRALSDSEARFRSAFEHSALGLALVGLDGRWLRVNQALCKIVGYTEAELLARDFQSVTFPEDLAPELQLAARLVAGEIDTFSLEKRYVHKGGHLVWVRLDVTLVQDPARRLPGYFIAQVHDITAHRRSRELLRAAKDEAEKANEAKNAFLSRMSHELRTPLNAILGFSQLLEAADLGECHNQSISHIVSSGRHLLALIDEVLDIAQIEGGQFVLHLESTPVFEIMENVASQVRAQADAAGIFLRLERPDAPATLCIRGDPRRLRQALLSLLFNALKYNHPGGSITLRCVAPPGRVRLEVVDTGVGISAGDLEQIFRPFIRLRATEGVRGTGLGLSVAKALAEVMGGALSVSSVPGRGSTFALEFDRLSDQETSREPRPFLDGLPAGFYEEPARDGTVLYVEDNPDNLQLVRYLFTDMPGRRLLTAATGSAGIASALADPPDLILLDLDLPDMTGAEVLQHLGRHPALAKIPVVVVSADATTRQIETLRALGVRDYLTKPINLTRFRQVVDEMLPVAHPL